MPAIAPAPAILLFTCGVMVIAFELNRPGRILPGCAGLVAALLAVSQLARTPHPAGCIALLLGAIAAAIVNLLRFRRILSVVTAILLLASFLVAATAPPRRPWPLLIAFASALALAFALDHLAGVTQRARANKRAGGRNKGRGSAANDLD